MKYQVKEVKISTALYSMRIAKNEDFSKTGVTLVTFFIYDNMFVNRYYTQDFFFQGRC